MKTPRDMGPAYSVIVAATVVIPKLIYPFGGIKPDSTFRVLIRKVSHEYKNFPCFSHNNGPVA